MLVNIEKYSKVTVLLAMAALVSLAVLGGRRKRNRAAKLPTQSLGHGSLSSPHRGSRTSWCTKPTQPVEHCLPSTIKWHRV